ncbi:hypothetical protein COT72_04570 [archaeon CG10_big_fil_rev_8_21_14_0_10_43_11]|nr:MAG: hypothetical protein COT72_04570 [archaeon CG10_big_fil_rev_8_21_14_0_10_43_11]
MRRKQVVLAALLSLTSVFAQNLSLPSVVSNVMPEFDVLHDISVAQLISGIILFVLALLLSRALRVFLTYVSERTTRYRLMIKNVVPIIMFLIYSVTFLLILTSVFRIPSGTLVAGVGIVVISLGFGAKEIIANILSGIMLTWSKSYSVGDKISVDNFYGEVKSVGLFDTRIQTLDDTQVSIPNSLVQTRQLANATSGGLSMLVITTFYTAPENDPRLVKKILWEAAVGSSYCNFHKPVSIVVSEGTHFTQFVVKAYVFDQRREVAFRTDIALRVKEVFKKEKITYPRFSGYDTV